MDRQMDDACLHYKLTYEPKDSGELKMNIFRKLNCVF